MRTTYDPSRDHDPLIPVSSCGRTTAPAPEPAAPSSVKWGACPGHAAAGKLTGVVVQGEHLAWRHHYKRTVSGVQIECSVSGQRVCEAPAAPSANHSGPHCTCHSAHAPVSGPIDPPAGTETPDPENAPESGAQR